MMPAMIFGDGPITKPLRGDIDVRSTISAASWDACIALSLTAAYLACVLLPVRSRAIRKRR